MSRIESITLVCEPNPIKVSATAQYGTADEVLLLLLKTPASLKGSYRMKRWNTLISLFMPPFHALHHRFNIYSCLPFPSASFVLSGMRLFCLLCGFACTPPSLQATVFIDASYDGDVMVAAGDIEYTAGREAVAQYNESYAGARAPGFVGVGGPRGIDALKPDGTLLKYVVLEEPPRYPRRHLATPRTLSVMLSSRQSAVLHCLHHLS